MKKIWKNWVAVILYLNPYYTVVMALLYIYLSATVYHKKLSMREQINMFLQTMVSVGIYWVLTTHYEEIGIGFHLLLILVWLLPSAYLMIEIAIQASRRGE